MWFCFYLQCWIAKSLSLLCYRCIVIFDMILEEVVVMEIGLVGLPCVTFHLAMIRILVMQFVDK